MLVKCSHFIPWCWLLWGDHRIAGFECIVYLVRNPFSVAIARTDYLVQSVIWLDQFKNDGGPFGTDSMQRLHNFIQTHPACSLNMLLVL